MKTTRKSKKKCTKGNKQKTNENQRKSVHEVEEQRKNLKSVTSIKTKEKAWTKRRWNKAIKEIVMVIIKKEKKKENNGKSKKKQQLDGRGYKRIQRVFRKYSQWKLHQSSDLEVRKCGKTCKRGPAWYCDVNNT